MSPRALLIAAGLIAAGCAAAQRGAPTPASDASIRYTLVNLHPDEGRLRLYTVNFQQPGLIHRCTAVRFTETRDTFVIFEIVSTGRRYLYMRAASAREPFERNLARYFGTSCDPDAVARLSPVDQHGVQRGRAMPGMTKDGVIFAIGYPAEHDTPDLTADVWTYWKNRHQSFEVQFADGVVTRIKE